jgi:hypothetical protein
VPTTGARWRAATTITLISLSLAAGLAACSANGSTSDSSSGSRAGAPAAGKAQGPAEKAPSGAGTAGLPAKAVTDDRSIVYTGSVTVRVKGDVADAANTLADRVRAAGGYVGTEKRSTDGGTGADTLTLRVPSGRFASILDEAAGLGSEVGREVSTEDVTDQMVDLEARLATARASVTRVRALLARAQTISDITSIEAELAKREGDLEALEGRKRSLDDLTTLSTITVTLLGPRAPAPAPAATKLGFLTGLGAGWAALVGFVRVALTVLGALLPFLVVIACVLVPVLWLVRRRRRNAVPSTAGPAAAAVGGVPRPPAPQR